MGVYTFSGTRKATTIAYQIYGNYNLWQDMLIANGIYNGMLIPENIPSLSVYTEEELKSRLVSKYHIPSLSYF